MSQEIRIFFLSIISLSLVVCCTSAKKKDYPIQPVPFTDVQINDTFWKSRMEINRIILPSPAD